MGTLPEYWLSWVLETHILIFEVLIDPHISAIKVLNGYHALISDFRGSRGSLGPIHT